MSDLRFMSPLTMRGKEWKKAGHFAFGKSAETEQLPAMDKHQMSYLKNILGQLKGQNINLNQSPMFQQGESYLSDLLSGSPESTAAFEAPAMRQFQEQIMPMIMERFAGTGTSNSSGLQQTLAQAGGSLAERLQDMRSRLQFGGAQQALGYAEAPMQNAYNFGNMGLGAKPFGYNFKPATQGLFGGMAQGLGQGIGSAGMAAML